MAQRTSPTERHVSPPPPRLSRRRLSRRQRRELRRLERQLVGRRWRPWGRREGSATEVDASELDAVIERHVQKEVDRRMEELTETMLRRQDKLMARAWQAFNRRARQTGQPAQRKSRAKRPADREAEPRS